MEITPKTATKFKSVYSTSKDISEDASPCGSSVEKVRRWLSFVLFKSLCVTLSCFQSHHKLSASLRERLKRSRRSFTSPLSVAKRLCVDEDDCAQQVTATTEETINNPAVIMHNVDQNRDVLRSSSDSCAGPTCDQSSDLILQQDHLRREVKDKAETLRRLKLVKMYRSKVTAGL